MPVNFTILGSGSAGNCAYLESEETRILIDAGFSARQIRQRLEALGRSPETLDGILVTHEHSDHTKGLNTLAGKLGIPIFCNRLTREAIESQAGNPLDYRLFNTGSTFDIGDLTIDTFSIPHDAYDPVGFLIRTAHGNVGILTDLGHSTKLAVQRVREAHILLLETNYDMELLQQDTKRPWSVKQRILSRHGHLSNEAAADLLEEILNDDLEHVFLAHLSRDCNTNELAKETITKRLRKLGADHVQVHSTWQDKSAATLELAKGFQEPAPEKADEPQEMAMANSSREPAVTEVYEQQLLF